MSDTVYEVGAAGHWLEMILARTGRHPAGPKVPKNRWQQTSVRYKGLPVRRTPNTTGAKVRQMCDACLLGEHSVCADPQSCRCICTESKVA